MRAIARRRRLVIVLGLVAAYAGVMTFGGCADRLILYPSRDRVDVPGGQRLEIQVSETSQVIEIWSAKTPAARGAEPRAFVLSFIGNADRAEYCVQRDVARFLEFPVEVWAVNYPGYGASSGPATLKGIAPAALAVYDELHRRAGERPIFLTGVSLGTAAALHVAANRPVAGLVLHNPPPLRELILGRFGWWNLWLAAGPIAMQIPPPLDSIANARRVNAPAVFLLADADEIVLPAYQQKVVAAYAGQTNKVVLPGADHNTPAEAVAPDEVRAAVRWLWDRGAPRRD